MPQHARRADIGHRERSRSPVRNPIVRRDRGRPRNEQPDRPHRRGYGQYGTRRDPSEFEYVEGTAGQVTTRVGLRRIQEQGGDTYQPNSPTTASSPSIRHQRSKFQRRTGCSSSTCTGPKKTFPPTRNRPGRSTRGRKRSAGQPARGRSRIATCRVHARAATGRRRCASIMGRGIKHGTRLAARSLHQLPSHC